MPRHAHAELGLTLILAGGVREDVSGAEAEPVPLSVGVKPAGIEHANRFAPTGTRTVSLNVDLEWLARFGPVAPELCTWRWISGGAAVQVFLRIASALSERVPATQWLEPAVLDLIAALAEDGRLRSRSAPQWLHRVRERLLDDVTQGVTASEVAIEAGMHPVALARAFRRHFGESMTECIRRARVQAAARAIEDGRVSLAEAASIAGFADQSHLTRLCLSETGLTPRGLRRLQAMA